MRPETSFSHSTRAPWSIVFHIYYVQCFTFLSANVEFPILLNVASFQWRTKLSSLADSSVYGKSMIYETLFMRLGFWWVWLSVFPARDLPRFKHIRGQSLVEETRSAKGQQMEYANQRNSTTHVSPLTVAETYNGPNKNSFNARLFLREAARLHNQLGIQCIFFSFRSVKNGSLATSRYRRSIDCQSRQRFFSPNEPS